MSWTRRSLFAVCLVPLVFGATLTSSASAAGAHQSITLAATLHGQTLEVTGSNFVPGTAVAVALIDTRNWQPIVRGSAMAETTIYQCSSGTSSMCCRRVSSVVCGHRDTSAGALYFQAALHQRPTPAVLALLYRSGNEVGVGRVHRQ